MADADAAFFRSLLAEEPELASVCVDLAQALLAAADPDGAMAESTTALDHDPSLVPAWLVRATIHKALGSFAAAASDFEQAARLSPARPMILVNPANSYAEMGRLTAAERRLGSSPARG